MNKTFVTTLLSAAVCAICAIAGPAAHAGGSHGVDPAAAGQGAGAPEGEAARGVEAAHDGRERPSGGLRAEDKRPADRTPSFSEEDERVDNQVEDSDAGTTATESGASEHGDAPKPGEPEGSGVVAPKEP